MMRHTDPIDARPKPAFVRYGRLKCPSGPTWTLEATVAKYERKPSVDEICRMILGRGADDLRAWAAAHPEKADLVESYGRAFYEAGAPECWVVFSEDEEDEIEAIVVRLPNDPNGRRRCHTALNEYMYMVSDIRELDDFIDDVDHYFGQEYCWLRSFD